MSHLLKSAVLALSLAFIASIAAVGTVSAEEQIITSNQRFSVVKNNQGSYTWRTKDGQGGTEASAKDAKKAAKKALRKAKKADGVTADENCDRQPGVNC